MSSDADHYDYTNIQDMRRLANRVRAIPPESFKHIAPVVMSLGLMRTNRIIHFAVWFVAKRHRLSKAQAWSVMASRMERFDVNIFGDLQEELAKHIEAGKDAYDKRSAGGLCEVEVSSLLSLLGATAPVMNRPKAPPPGLKGEPAPFDPGKMNPWSGGTQ